MKIVVSSTGSTIDSFIDTRFGRCSYFLIVEIENNAIKNIEAVVNQGSLQAHGAGIVAAQQVAALKPDAVITGNLGPNSSMVLRQFNIPVYFSAKTARQAIEDFLGNSLKEILQPTQQGHGQQVQHEQTTQQLNEEKPDKHETEQTRILIPLEDNNNIDSKISEHFGHANFFGLYAEGNFEVFPNDLDHNADKPPAEAIIERYKPTIVFAKSIGLKAENIFLKHSIRIKTGDYGFAKEVMENISSLHDL